MKSALLTLLAITLLTGLAIPLSAADEPSTQSGKQEAQKGDIWTEPTTGMKFTWIETGCFQMGQIPLETRLLTREVGEYDYKKYYADEQPRHKVCVEGFWLATTEVTQKEWVQVMGFNPSHFNTDEDFPVDMVSWQDANNFINKLNKANNSEEFRLPTEAEWEYAARGNSETSTFYHTGNSITPNQANFNGSIPFGLNLREEYRKTPVQVGSFPANSFGIHDMHGNVWEWCYDWYDETYYEESPSKNPSGPEEGDMRVLRGGSWFRYSGHIRSATRYKNKPTGQYADTGFRVVKSTLKSSKATAGKIIFDLDF